MREINMDTVRSVERAVAILNSFTLEQPAQTVEQIMKKTKLARATVYRLLYTLEKCGLVSYDPKTLQYRLGTVFLGYSRLVSSTLDVVNVAKEILTDLHLKMKQTVMMAVIEKKELVYVFKREIESGLKYSSSVGERRPLCYGAMGRVGLAFLPEEVADEVLKEPISPLTPYTVTDPAVIKEELKQIRKSMIFVEQNQAYLGVTAIACPVFRFDGQIAAVIGMACPNIQLTDKQLNEAKALMLKSAQMISAQLGYTNYEIAVQHD